MFPFLSIHTLGVNENPSLEAELRPGTRVSFFLSVVKTETGKFGSNNAMQTTNKQKVETSLQRKYSFEGIKEGGTFLGSCRVSSPNPVPL